MCFFAVCRYCYSCCRSFFPYDNSSKSHNVSLSTFLKKNLCICSSFVIFRPKTSIFFGWWSRQLSWFVYWLKIRAMEVGKGQQIYISEGNQDFVSENRSIWELKIEPASSRKIKFYPCKNKVASNVYLASENWGHSLIFCFSI